MRSSRLMWGKIVTTPDFLYCQACICQTLAGIQLSHDHTRVCSSGKGRVGLMLQTALSGITYLDLWEK
jgi:hypothetical protein